MAKIKLLSRRKGGVLIPTKGGLQTITRWASEGTSKELVAMRLGMNPEKFEALLKNHAASARAYEQGLAEHEQLLINALTSQAVGDGETRGVTAAATQLLEKVHGKAPEQASSVTIVLPGAQALDDFLARTKVIEHKGDDA